MEIKANIETHRLIALMQHLSVDLRNLKKAKLRFVYKRWFKSYRFSDEVLEYNWAMFIDLNEVVNDYRNILSYLRKQTGVKRLVLPAYFTYPLWQFYAKEHEKVLMALSNINDNIKSESKTVAKDMNVFGLTNITDFLSGAKSIPHEHIEAKPVHWVLAEYMREVYKFANMQEKYKKK